MISDERSFDALVRAHHRDLLRFATRRVGPDAAADVVGEVLVVAWRRRDVMPSGAERVWLFGVAAKVIANEKRGAARRERLTHRMGAEPAIPSDPGETVTTGLVVRAALATLPPAEQEALRLSEWEQLTTDEAAQVAGCSRATFRVRLHRARRHLAARLGEPAPERETTQGQDVIA